MNPTDTARALVAEFESKIEDLNYATMSSAEWSRARAEEAANTARAALLAHVAGVEQAITRAIDLTIKAVDAQTVPREAQCIDYAAIIEAATRPAEARDA